MVEENRIKLTEMITIGPALKRALEKCGINIPNPSLISKILAEERESREKTTIKIKPPRFDKLLGKRLILSEEEIDHLNFVGYNEIRLNRAMSLKKGMYAYIFDKKGNRVGMVEFVMCEPGERETVLGFYFRDEYQSRRFSLNDN